MMRGGFARTWLANAAHQGTGLLSTALSPSRSNVNCRAGASRSRPTSSTPCMEAGESIYAPVPVSLSVELDAHGRVKSIAGDTPNPAAVTDAARYIKTLRDSGQLTSTGEQQSAAGVTHQIERDGTLQRPRLESDLIPT
jgi:hypothetical protein